MRTGLRVAQARYNYRSKPTDWLLQRRVGLVACVLACEDVLAERGYPVLNALLRERLRLMLELGA